MSDFIPKSYKKEQTTIRIDAEKMKKIDELANSFNLSRSEFINQCIDFALEHMAPESKTIRLPHQIFHAILTLPCPT